MIVRINIRQPYLRQQLNVEFLIASLAETFQLTCLVFIQPRFAKNTPLRE